MAAVNSCKYARNVKSSNVRNRLKFAKISRKDDDNGNEKATARTSEDFPPTD